MKRTLVAMLGAALAVAVLSGCSDDEPVAPSVTPTPTVSTTPSPTAGTSPSPSASETIAPEDVTEEQKQACTEAIVTQLRNKKAAEIPPECAILPQEIVAQLIQVALSGGGATS